MTEEVFAPRRQFLPYHERTKRWSCIVAHRRAGKTLACVMDLITRALATSKPYARYGYVAPFYAQAKQVAWDYLKRHSEGLWAEPPKESELSIKLHNGSTIRLYGADNENAIRGVYFDGIILDEYADMKGTVWQEVIRPALSDRKGWATFIGTPRGRNSFWDIYTQARTDPDWLCLTLRASETGLIERHELADAKKQMTESAYRQEYECDFDAPVLGAIFAEELMAAREEGRICEVKHDPILQVHTAWDLGMDDMTCIWYWQQANGEYRFIGYDEASGEGLPYYADLLQSKGYVYGNHFAPHDIQVRELGSGLSRIEVARSLGINFQVVPNVPVEDGIHASRMALQRCWFDEDACRLGLEALHHYKREWVDKNRTFKKQPLHDWASHASDSFRYFALASRGNRDRRPMTRERRGSWMVR